MFSVPVIEFSLIYHSLFQVARRIASSRHPSCSFPPHESPSFLHASASSCRPVWDYLSTILTSSPSLWPPASSHRTTWHGHRRPARQRPRNIFRFTLLGISEFARESEKQTNDSNAKTFFH